LISLIIFYGIVCKADGTQLAAVSHEPGIIVWNYPSGAILFQKKMFNEPMNQIEWNPFRPNVFAAFINLNVSCFFIHNLFPSRRQIYGM
jgi:hypothetical protein